MSALVKKRNYTETLRESWPETLTNLPKKLHQLNISKPNTSAKSTLQKNLEELKSLFHGIDEKELISTLEDCDNNLSMAKQVVTAIKNDKYLDFEEVKQSPPMTSLKETTISTSKQSLEVNPKISSTDMMDENLERKIAVQKASQNLEYQQLSAFLLEGLKSIPSMESASDFLYQNLIHYMSKKQEKYSSELSKEKEDKTIMVKSFQKLRERNKKLHLEVTEKQRLANTYTNQVNQLQAVNYHVALRLKSVDPKILDGIVQNNNNISSYFHQMNGDEL